MLHYLINCTAIWLLALVCFDVFLRRSTIHAYNRAYLISTLLAGIFIPLFSFVQRANFSQQTKEVYGLDRTFTLKSDIASTAQISNHIEWSTWLWVIYLLGAALSLGLLLFDVLKAFRLYRRGSKTTIDGLWLIETQKNHHPFSFFGFIFIGNTKVYKGEELAMVLAHEKQHNTLWHSMDLLLLQCCKIIFWFHPLVYIYLHRLRMLHEYQADQAIAKPLAEYGNFLVEQNMLARTPQLGHSFYYSPLKNRILMLTRTSSTWSKSKSLIIIPVLGIAIICFSKDAFSDNKRVIDGNKVTYKGNTFEMDAPPDDSALVKNPVSGKMEMQVFSIQPAPAKMNGTTLLTSNDVDENPVLKGIADNRLLAGILGQNRALLEKLEDGEYQMDVEQAVVGKNGELLYFHWAGIKNRKWTNGHADPVKPQEVKAEFDARLEKFIEKLQFHPAMKDGKPVVCSMFNLSGVTIAVKNHKVTVKDRY